MVNKEFSRKSGYHRPNALAHGYKTKLKRAVKYITEDGWKTGSLELNYLMYTIL